ncbi:hypothetical protein HMPREF0971_01499 [Segatella oris F0302]|uniref:Auxiliary transport protein, membrane fusion protein (MFP) family protein n=1 Tax=Segatella oris F0302 TaxID=649760 RepID=D1QR96_9BACT|nr:HlyD family efflux transporter periplasmic adaptor subunit [Segatella oris]EFB32220.1 hypothetical protein HMPREF0971_01499 [Segatella oris F0302]
MKINNTNFINDIHHEELDDIIERQPQWIIQRGIILLTLFVLFLFVGSWIIKYPQMISGKIVLTSQTPPTLLKTNFNGRLSELYVKDGQHVKANQRLALMYDAASIQDMDELSQFLKELKQATSLGVVCNLPVSTLKLGIIQDNFSALTVQVEEYNRFIKYNYISARIKAKEKLLNTNKIQEIIGAKQLSIAKEQYLLQKKSHARNATLYQRGLISSEEYEKTKIELFQQQSHLESMHTNITDITYSKEQLLSEILELQQDYSEKLNTLTMNIQANIERLLSLIRTWEIEHLLISPIDGVVTFTNYWAANQNVEAGKTVFSIIPLNKVAILGKVNLPVQGVGKVKIGQKVHVYLDNYPKNEFGQIDGKVKRISLIPDATNEYVAEIQFPHGLKTTYGKTLPRSQNMTGNADVIVEDTRLIEQLFLPIKELIYKQTSDY